MQLRIVFAALASLAIHQSYATVEQKIDEKAPLTVTFSRQSHNRISVENGFVRKLFGDQSLFTVSIDETIGQAFVNLLQDITEVPASLTIVTTSGQVQDILVFSDARPSEHLILREESEDMEDLPISTTEFQTHTIEFLNDILIGRTPLGYGKRDLREEDKLALPSPLEAIPIRAFEGPFEKVVVYQIGNKGRKPIVIKPESIKKQNDNWVFLDANEIDFTQQALCIISSPKE
jgi:hypothetical protein